MSEILLIVLLHLWISVQEIHFHPHSLLRVKSIGSVMTVRSATIIKQDVR